MEEKGWMPEKPQKQIGDEAQKKRELEKFYEEKVKQVQQTLAEDYRAIGTSYPNDPWAHRADGMKCKTCMWFVPKSGDKPAYDLGRCRRHAPTMNGYPVVFVNDWCGDHKVDENKI
jgi:hypothetical protein